jgi:hypothetical protein
MPFLEVCFCLWELFIFFLRQWLLTKWVERLMIKLLRSTRVESVLMDILRMVIIITRVMIINMEKIAIINHRL